MQTATTAVQLSIVNDLGFITFCAAIVTLIFYRFKMPVFLGYILSGLLISPNLLGSYSPVKNLESIQQLSDLGVIFLMFYVGIEFDLKKLKQSLNASFAAIVLQTIFCFFLGMHISSFLGWNHIQGIFLGALLSISSSMVSVAVMRNYKVLKQPFAQMAMGVLIMEDILAIIMLVLLNSLAKTGTLNVSSTLIISLAILVFMVAVFYFGRLISPSIVKALMRYANPELITLCSVGLMMGTSLLASEFNFSVALGAFLAGAIFSRSKLAEQIQSAQEPIRYLFCAIFFVSIGMLIQPKMLVDNAWIILAISVLVILCKTFSCWFGFLIAGEKPRDGFKAALVKSEIGEFSFIIATLGQALNVTDARLTTIAVGVALVTIISTPFLLEQSDNLFNIIRRITPPPIRRSSALYRDFANTIKEKLGKNASLANIQNAILKFILYTFIIIAVFVCCALILKMIGKSDLPQESRREIALVILFLTAVCCTPFISTLVSCANTLTFIFLSPLLGSKEKHHFRNRVIIILHKLGGLFVILAFTFIFSKILEQYIPEGWTFYIAICIFVGISIILSPRLLAINNRMESRISTSFAPDEFEEGKTSTIKSYVQTFPWPVAAIEIKIPTGSFCVGKTISETNLRSETGASIIGILRDGIVAHNPDPGTPLFANDTLIILGTSEQLTLAEKYIHTPAPEGKTANNDENTFEIQQIFLGKKSSIAGETLASADLRHKYRISVLGILREDEQITSPKADEILRIGDVLMVIGNKLAISALQSESEISEASSS